MSKQPSEGAQLVLGKTAGFRAPDQAFCDEFNLAMRATGLNLNDLSVCAIREGLPLAVAKRLSVLQEAAEMFSQKRPASLKNRK